MNDAYRQRPRRRRLLRAWSLVVIPIVGAAAVLVLRNVLSHRGSAQGSAEKRPGTVLFVSGYGASTGRLAELAAGLQDDGRTTVMVPAVGDNTGDLRVQAGELDRIARAQIAAGSPSVDVVGYSAGGVVVRLWAAELGGASLARRVVTLGSPHHGTDLAQLAVGLQLGCPVACQQLAPGSDLLAGLPETPPGPDWTSIWTADDDVVLPPTSAQLQGALNIELQQVCHTARVLHSQLPSAPLTEGLVRLALNGPALRVAPDPDRCAALTATGSVPSSQSS